MVNKPRLPLAIDSATAQRLRRENLSEDITIARAWSTTNPNAAYIRTAKRSVIDIDTRGILDYDEFVPFIGARDAIVKVTRDKDGQTIYENEALNKLVGNPSEFNRTLDALLSCSTWPYP